MKFFVRKSLIWSGSSISDNDGYETKSEPMDEPSMRPHKAKKMKSKSEVAERSKRRPAKGSTPSKTSGRVKSGLKIRPDTGFGRVIVKAQKTYGYTGPMSVADITLASWNEFFREGGSLNQPAWLETNRLSKIRRNYARLARLHSPISKAFKK